MSPPLRPPSKRSVAALFMVVAAALAALGALRVHRQHELLRLGYELTEATAELRDAREENRRLRLELSVLTAPERIERLAEGMGLEPPAPGQVRTAGLAGARARAEPAERGGEGEDVRAEAGEGRPPR